MKEDGGRIGREQRFVPADLPLALYEAIGGMAGPALRAMHRRRVAQGKEDPHRRGERFGYASRPRGEGVVVWYHAASVGEANALLPIVRRLAGLGYPGVMTTGTVASAETVAPRLPANVHHQFVPYDTRPGVERFLDHWRPALAVMVESEIWPATFRALKRRKTPLAIVNGRMSPASTGGWMKFRPFAKRLFGHIDLCLARTEEDAGNYKLLGVSRVELAGDLKFDAELPDADSDLLGEFRQAIGNRPVWLAASTHPGEEEIAALAHRRVAAEVPGLLTLIAPRHPVRGDEIRHLLAEAGLSVAQRSQGEPLTDATDVYLADTIGEMGLFFRLSRIVLLGASLVPLGGHNPLEPAQCGAAILTGPSFPNQKDVYDRLIAERGAIVVNDADDLATTLKNLLGDPDEVGSIGAAAHRVALEGKGAVERSVDALLALLPEPSGAFRK